MAYKAVLTHLQPLAGCIALSTWLEPSLKDVRGWLAPRLDAGFSQLVHRRLPALGAAGARGTPGRPPTPRRPPPPLHATPLPAPQVPAANTALPIFVGHGSVDNLIPPVIATTTQDVLEGLGCSNVEFRMQVVRLLEGSLLARSCTALAADAAG